ncbi:hypothetical protein HYR99_20580 [Candidatus Poribacteria bacterium]|nr:hypothetical protein [Candidatus Poribacteria bacterium]
MMIFSHINNSPGGFSKNASLNPWFIARWRCEDSLQREVQERLKAEQERRKQLYSRLDEHAKSHFRSLMQLEKFLQDKVKDLGNQLANAQIVSTAAEVINEAMRSLENRATYTALLGQSDILKLAEDLALTKAKYEREKDYVLKKEYRETIQALTDELNGLKKLKASMEQLEQDVITAQSSLRTTILLLSQPQSTDHASRLDEQVAKLRREVEIAKKVNAELASFQIRPRLGA